MDKHSPICEIHYPGFGYPFEPYIQNFIIL